MSVVGIDFGNLSLLIGQTSKGGVDVILNDASNRQTSTTVSIQGKQRFIGDSGAAMAKSNIKNTVSGMKLLVGRQYDDKDVQAELSKSFFAHQKLPCGGVGIRIMLNDEPTVISAEHFMAMMLVKAKEISAGANAGLNLADAVLAVPFWFTQSQRQGVLNACQIAAVNCLKVANENTLIALSYGIFKSAKKLFHETEPTYVMFVDLGYTCYSVCIVEFIQENMKVLATVCDRNMGGRDFDNVIIEILAEQFEKKTKINVRNTPKAILKLGAGAEKAKKTLSPAGVSECPISVECLSEDYDLNAVLTKEELEERAESLVCRLEAPIVQALAEAKLTKEQLSETEILGGSSRINVVKRTLGKILGLDPAAMNYGLKTTMNADEAVARGGALQCAMLSSRMKVKPFNITDRIPYGIAARFNDEEDPTKETSVGLYCKGDEIPHKPRRLTFKNKNSDFSIVIEYDDEALSQLPVGESRFLGKYTIQYPANFSPCDVRVTWNLDKNGSVYVQSAELLEELKVEEEKKEGEDKKDGEDKKEGEEKGAEGEAKGGDSKEDMPPAAPAAAKKRFKKTDLVVVPSLPGLTSQDIKDSIELEAQMAFDDKLITETADKRNELESYIYSMRDKMDGLYKTYITAGEKDELSKKLGSAEDWLYGDGYDSTKQEYGRQLDSLKEIGSPVEFRYYEDTVARPDATALLKKQLDMCKQFASKYDDNTAHILEEERESLRKEVQKTENWMYDMIGKQGDLAASATPCLTSEIISKKRNDLHAFSNPIITKPKPKPAPAPAPAPTPVPESKSADEKGNEADQKSAAPEEGAPMDQAKDEGAEASGDK